MKKLQRCVIDGDKMYMNLVTVEEGSEISRHYTMKQGETLIKVSPPGGLIKPRWNGTNWDEIATPAEIEAAEKVQYESMGLPWPPEPPEPSEMEYLTESVLDLDFRVTMQELGL